VRIGMSAVLAVLAVVVSGCGVRMLTRQDQVAVSVALSKAPPGTVVTEREKILADQDKTVVCDTTTVVGSHIPTRRCRTMRQIEEEKRKAQERYPGGCMQGGDITGHANVQRVPCKDEPG